MFIKDIILDGFKCYENLTVIRNLDKSYNAITGLNGSGKSNVIDAIVFALGLESKKLLRATTLKDLINTHRKDCKVTLVLSNKDKDKSPPGYKDYDEITIARFLDATGKSKYFLNDHVCSNSTISKLCSSIGINSEKGEFFFIVMQGHITKILNMKSKEIGTLIEETAGTRSYTKEKERALQVLEKKEIKLKGVRDAMERRISPFYDRLSKEREAYIEQKHIEENKKKIQEEIDSLKDLLERVELSKTLIELKECIEAYVGESTELKMIEEKILRLQADDQMSEEVGLKDALEDEKIKLEGLRARGIEKEILKLASVQKTLKPSQVKVGLEELKEKEKIILEDLRSDGGIFGDSNKIQKLEELAGLKNKKIEAEYKIKSIKVDKDFTEDKISALEKHQVDQSELRDKIERLNYLKSRISYPFIEGVFGSVGENIALVDEKHREAIFTILGNKAKHIIVSDEVVGGRLLKSADRRISVIPLNKIVTKHLPFEVVKKIISHGGRNALDLVKYDVSLKKAIEHALSNFFVFEKKEEAKKACFDYNVYCVTLDGIVYDPKGTVTGGKSVYKVEIISRKEIERLEEEVRVLNANNLHFKKSRAEYERLLKQRALAKELAALKDLVKGLEVKIETLNQITEGCGNLKEELDTVRSQIVRVAAEEKKNLEIQKKKEEIQKELEHLEKLKERNNSQIEECLKTIKALEGRMRLNETHARTRRLSEKQAEDLETRQKQLIRTVFRMKNKIKKLSEQAEERSQKGPTSQTTPLVDGDWVSNFLRGPIHLDFVRPGLFENEILRMSAEEEKLLTVRLAKAKETLCKLGARKSIRMDPSNFNLLEKYDLDIRGLKEKIKKIEKDKEKILGSITNFDTLGKKEIDKAFGHINRKLGAFLRYFIVDSDSKIVKDGSNYELKVKIGNWKDSLMELSGGQRSLVALCLIFSMLTYKPAPFYIFDEIDAALDLSYTQSIGEIIKKEFNAAQFLIISLKNGMYDNANSVYKVFIKDGKSKIAQIKNRHIQQPENEDGGILTSNPIEPKTKHQSSKDTLSRVYKMIYSRFGLLFGVAVFSIIFGLIFWSFKIDVKDKGGGRDEIDLKVIFFLLSFIILNFLGLSLLLYHTSYFALKRSYALNSTFYYVNELSEHIALGIICMGGMIILLFYPFNYCFTNTHGYDVYLGDVFNISLVVVFMFGCLKIWTKSISMNFNYEIYVERTLRVLIDEILISSLKIIAKPMEENVGDSKDNPLRISSGALNKTCGFSGSEILNIFLGEKKEKNMLSTRRILLKEFQKFCKNKVVDYELPLDGERVNKLDHEEADKLFEDLQDIGTINTLRDFSFFLKDPSHIHKIGEMVKLPLDFTLEKENYFFIINRITREKFYLLRNLVQMNQAIDRVAFVFKMVILVLGGIMLYIKISKELTATATIISAVFGTQFISHSFSSNAINSMIFLFFIHPYDIGDRVFIDINNKTENLVVSELNVFSTVFFRWDGTCVYVPNVLLLGKLICNVRRSGIMGESHKIQINTRTNQNKLNKLRCCIEDYVKKNSDKYTEYFMLNYEFIENSNKLHMKVYMQYKENWQDYGSYLTYKTEFISFLNRTLHTLEIEYTLPHQRVVLKNIEEAST